MSLPDAPSRRLLAGVFVVCLANLLLEVTLTRIFSATMFYHFTFLAIALALFGMAASGVYVYVRSAELAAQPIDCLLARYGRRFAAATIVAVIYVLANPIDILIVTGTSQVPSFQKRTLLQLLLLNGVSAVPFFYAGMVVALAVAHYRKHIERVYFFDLAGAGVAALVCGSLVGLLGAPTLVCLIAALAAVAAALFRTPRGFGWAPLAATVGLVVLNLATAIIAVPTVKGVRSDKTIFEKWNVFSRVTVDSSNEIKIDASAATHITKLADMQPQAQAKDITALAYTTLSPPSKLTLVIGPGGGRDVAHALVAGSEHVVGVEVNPIIAETIMKERFADVSGRLYLDPRVQVVADEGRSYLRRSKERYDVVQASLVDTWAATAAGAFALTENTLYTVEAFEDYYEHLTDRGIVTMTRWNTGQRSESARLLILAAAALENRGVARGETRKYIYYAVKDSLGTLIAKRTPFTDDEVGRLDAACQAAGFQILVSPRTHGDSPIERYLADGAYGPLVAAQNEDLSPPTDDRPFFFYFVKPAGLFNFVGAGGEVSLNNPALWIVICFGAVGALTIVFILLPLFEKTGALRGPDGRFSGRRGATLVYFALLGVAFITVEIALLQKFTFFLGHPSNALLVVLFALLVGTALGARASASVTPARRARAVATAGVVMAAACLVLAFLVTPALRAWVGWPFAARALLSALLVGACGVAMGFLMPIGIQQAGEHDPELIPWGWGLNGALSVLGTVGATVLAIHAGFTVTLLSGGVLYLLAPLAFRAARSAA